MRCKLSAVVVFPKKNYALTQFRAADISRLKETYKDEEPFSREFSPVYSISVELTRTIGLSADRRYAARHHFRCIVAVFSAQDRFDRLGVDPGGGYRDHVVPYSLKDRHARRNDT